MAVGLLGKDLGTDETLMHQVQVQFHS